MCLFRCALAPLIESCILIDRLLFILKSEVTSTAYLRPVFDPRISARNIAIVAIKK